MGRVIHRQAATGGWAKLELVEQLGNVGSEVDRAIRSWEAGNTHRFDDHFARALELFDLTTEDPRWLGPRCQEIRRAREEFCRLFFDPDVPPGSAEGISRYFLWFGFAARDLHYRRRERVRREGG